jgi:hypothetical protein
MSKCLLNFRIMDKPLHFGLVNERVLFSLENPERLYVADSVWDWCQRIVSWVWSPWFYSDLNRKTVHCFREYLIGHIGEERLNRISKRYNFDFQEMEKTGKPLLASHVAQVVVGVRDLRIEDIIEILQNKVLQPPHLRDKLSQIHSMEELDGQTLGELYDAMNGLLPESWRMEEVGECSGGEPTKALACFFFNQGLADQERLHLCEEHPKDPMDVFVHNMVARVIRREMQVGTLVRAPDSSKGTPQYYYLSGKLITGKGMVSYLFHPATKDSELEPIRMFRGSAFRSSEIDACSTFITDSERVFGKAAFESGKPYEEIIREVLPKVEVEAGHSLGSTLVQYRLANYDHIKKAYLYNGPGIPRKEVKKFNKMVGEKELVIRHATLDPCSQFGQVHIGYNAPSNVAIDYIKYHTPLGDNKDPHIAVWAKERLRYGHGIEGGITQKVLNSEFDHRHSLLEKIRVLIGPILSAIAKILCKFSRSYFGSRALTERGLKIGTIERGKWKVREFLAEQKSSSVYSIS